MWQSMDVEEGVWMEGQLAITEGRRRGIGCGQRDVDGWWMESWEENVGKERETWRVSVEE